MAKRIVQFANIWFDDNGRQEFAQRGQEVDLSSSEEKRLDDLGALLVKGETEIPEPFELQGLRLDSTDEEIHRHLNDGKANEIADQAADYPPSLVQRIIDIENARQNPRKSLVAKLTKLTEEESPEDATGDEETPLTP